MAETVVGLFDDHDDAEKAVRELIDNGVDRKHVSVVASDPDGKYKNLKVDDRGNVAAEGAATGAATGAVIGGIIGLLVSGGTLALPLAGMMFVGPIAGVLGGAGIGAIAGGMVGALIGLGIPKRDAETYAEAVRRGGTLVAVDAVGVNASTVSDIMENHNPVDISEREEHYRREGWTGYDAKAQPLTQQEIEAERQRHRTATTSGRRPEQGRIDQSRTDQGRVDQGRMDQGHMDQGEKIDVVKEDVTIGKREVQSGGARLRTYMHERPVEEELTLREEHVNVDRRQVDRPASGRDFENFKEGTIEMTETREEPVVQKEARVVEEVSINKTSDTRTERVQETVREMHVDVEEIDQAHGRDFESDFEQRYAGGGGKYDDYKPAYEHGARAAKDQRFNNRDWNQVEGDLRNEWERTNPGTWDTYQDAIHTGWDRERVNAGHGRGTVR